MNPYNHWKWNSLILLYHYSSFKETNLIGLKIEINLITKLNKKVKAVLQIDEIKVLQLM